MSNTTMKDIVNLCQNRGFVYPGSEIYGGLANAWDYGPYGSLMKENIKFLWLKEFVQKRTDIVLLDCALFMNSKVWEASGHLGGFSDPLMDCKACKSRWRADKLIDEYLEKNKDSEAPNNYASDKTDPKDLEHFIKAKGLKCPDCGAQDFTEIRKFNLMLKSYLGVTEDTTSQVYLRPETAQGQFINFANVLRSSRKKLPFGVAQVGKSFRNEITPGNFIFRTREFEQMEIEYFVEPGTDESIYKDFQYQSDTFFKNTIGLKAENVRFVPLKQDELPHYSKSAGDFEYHYPFGWGEIQTLANRGDYDLSAHMKASKQDLSYFDPVNNKKFIPYVIEPALGLGRIFLALLCDAYTVDGERTYLKLDPKVAPIKVGVLPVVKKISNIATKIYNQLSEDFLCEYDEVGSIGKRYARFDEIGTPLCVTIDTENYENNTVTVRFRDSMEQQLVSIDTLNDFVRKQLKESQKKSFVRTKM